MTARSRSDQRTTTTEIPEQIGVRLNEALRATLARYTGAHGYAVAVRTMIDGYDLIVTRERPEIAPNEWRALFDVCNGIWFEPLEIWASGTSIALELNGSPLAAAKWSITRERWDALVHEVAAWRPAQALAAVSVIQRFWERASDSGARDGDPDAVPGEPGWSDPDPVSRRRRLLARLVKGDGSTYQRASVCRALRELEREGLIRYDAPRWYLTEDGRAWLTSVIGVRSERRAPGRLSRARPRSRARRHHGDPA